nr:10651_t:CDS:2 [Entrophospora candida]
MTGKDVKKKVRKVKEGGYNKNPCGKCKKKRQKCELSCPGRKNNSSEFDEEMKSHVLNGKKNMCFSKPAPTNGTGDVFQGYPTDFGKGYSYSENNLSSEDFLQDTFTYQMMEGITTPCVSNEDFLKDTFTYQIIKGIDIPYNLIPWFEFNIEFNNS